MIKRLCALIGATLLSLFAITALSAAAAGDYAKGHGTRVDARFSFTAQGTGAGDRANGNMSHTENDPTGNAINATYTGDVTCMVIVGRNAAIGGRITSIKPASAAATEGNPQGFLIFVTDNAKPSGGLDGYVFSTVASPPPACPAPFNVVGDVEKGDVEIIPGP